MNLFAKSLRHFHWLHLPGAVLLALLQRTPAVRVVTTASEIILRSPAGALLKSAVAAIGSMGALHTMAGATTLSPSSPSPTSATVGTSKTVAFSAIGAQSAGESWVVGGSVPPGLTFNNGASSGTVNTPNGVLIMSGTPTTAGTFVLSLRAWEKPNAGGESSPLWSYTVVVTGGATATAPSFTTHPATQTVTAGANVTFTVAATGSPTPTLQWRKNGSNLAGQTGTSLTLSSVSATDAGSYTCVASNSAGSTTSNAATLTVNAATVAPAFTTHPATQTVTAGANVTFTVAATGSPTPTLQWQKNGSNLAGQTGTSLTLSSVAIADAGSYTCVATNSAGPATSNAATLTVNAANVAPAFTTQPAAQTVPPGTNVTFTVAATGTPTPTLQWQKNGANLTGQTGPSLTLTAVAASDAASYTCIATNTAGTATSNPATLTLSVVAIAPAFSTQPISQTVAAAANVTFTVVTTGAPTPTLQWEKNGSAIAGKTGASLALTNVQVADAGSYTCIATNTAGTATSSAAALTVNPVTVAPAFSTHPASQTVNAGTTVTFAVVATGSPVPTIQWRKNGTVLAGQTGLSLVLPNVQSTDAGSYVCVATNTVSSATSNSATLTLNAVPVPNTPPAFTTQPVAQSVSAGATVTLTVAVTGSPTPTLQWLKDGSSLAGQNSASLTIAGIQASDAGAYTCIASNSAGAVTSNAAAVSVAAPTGPDSRISNVSVRTTLAAAQTLIVGFTMQGGSKLVLVRAVGPGLANFGVAGTMSDPKLLLYKDAAMLTQNDNWGGGSNLSTAFASVGAFPLTVTSLDAALMRTVEGGHTAQVTGPAGGNVLVEAYDAGTGASPRLSNISARNFVGTGGDILIAGFTVAGTSPKNLLIRAVGPTLGVFGVPGTLNDPKVSVYNSAGTVIAENDTWNASLAPVFASVGAFALAPGSKDAAFTLTLPPGAYTVQVSGADGGTGEALVELYELP